MPAIAASAQQYGVRFYWHLGDFRANYNIDEDISRRPEYQSKSLALSLEDYRRMAWQDFKDHQLMPFDPVPVFLGIGNHELGDPLNVVHTRDEYIDAFRKWLDQPPIAQTRLADDPSDSKPQTHYHWQESGVDFINMDNASNDQFDARQMAWFRRVAARDESDPKVLTIVVGMHKALPDSLSFSHSMSETNAPLPIDSGREVYRELLKAHSQASKNVYILASHSHFYMDGIFNTEYWRENGGVLPGWIVGTAGAQRYMLPDDWRQANLAIQHVYGYLLATVNPRAGEGESADGSIRFEFKLLNKSDVPPQIEQRFSPALVDFCFDQNVSNKRL